MAKFWTPEDIGRLADVESEQDFKADIHRKRKTVPYGPYPTPEAAQYLANLLNILGSLTIPEV